MKKKIISILILLIVSITCFSLYACNEQPPAAFKKQESLLVGKGDNYVEKRKLNEYNVKYETDPTKTVNEEFKARLENNDDHYTKNDPYYDEDYDVTFREMHADAEYNQMCDFGLNDDIFYPGALIDHVTSTPIEIARAPLTITLNGLEGTVNVPELQKTEIVNEPSLAKVKDKIQTLVGNVFGVQNANVPSRVTMDIKEFESAEEFYFGLGFGVKFSAFDLEEQFDYKKNKKQTNLAIVLKQTYFDVTVSREGYGEYQFFDESIPKNQIREMIGDEKIPTYISSVSYGKIAVINIATNFTKEDIENKLSAGWNKETGIINLSGPSVGFESELTSLMEDKSTEINVTIYGGTQEGLASVPGAMTASNLSQLIKDFTSGDIGNLGAMPILYTFRHLDGSLAKFQETTDYIIKDVTYNPKYLANWEWLDDMIENEEIKKLDTLTIDFLGMGKDDFYANRIIKVPSNIKTLVLRGGNNVYSGLTYENLSVEVAYRENPLTIVLEHININGYTQTEIKDKTPTGYDPKPFISCDVGVDITVKVVGDVCIRGGEGSSAIKVENLIISGSGKFDVYGGDGKDGVSGNDELAKNGVNGASALDCENIIIKDMTEISKIYLYGGNGGNGAKGNDQQLECRSGDAPEKTATNGGRGGNGGDAVNCEGMNIMSVIKIYFYGGNGGNGGVGGSVTTGGSYSDHAILPNGADGGNGGNGGFSIDEEANLFVVKNIKILSLLCGNGGDGGTGGDGGDAIDDPSASFSYRVKPDYAGKGGTGGQGGSGHNGGNGGNGGTGGDSFEGNGAGRCGSGGYAGDGGDSLAGVVYKVGISETVMGEVGLGGTGGMAGISTHETAGSGANLSHVVWFSGNYIDYQYNITIIE